MQTTYKNVREAFHSIPERASAIPSASYRGLAHDWSILLIADSARVCLQNNNGSYAVNDSIDSESVQLKLTASDEDWLMLFSDEPPAGLQTLFGGVMSARVSVEGDTLFFDQNLFLLELLLGTLKAVDPEPVTAGVPQLENITGRYINLTHQSLAYRVYFEEAGSGIPLLCLHTAGADGRQFREILKDPLITENYRVIVFDLPRHGKSAPPAGFIKNPYLLTTEFYVSFVMCMVDALQLQQPVIMGCSIGGRAVLHLALAHADKFRAAIGLQSALFADAGDNSAFSGSRVASLYRPDVNSQELAAAQVAGIMAPNSPDKHKWETLWYYMQGGPGVFLGDLFYYFIDGDLRNGLAKNIDTDQCPLYLLTGEYDLSATPEMTAELADEVNATHFEVMKGLGHFPMSENPDLFKSYLMPVLDNIREKGTD
ncbi:MAG: alpha/beta hydrolase [Gammaproteobacteria bacterium]|nr:alpha/beta hydrolase [Gammaproteobacteria bacterium]